MLDPAKYPNGAFNPGGALNDANNITIAGTMRTSPPDSGLVIVDLDDPLNPTIVKRISFGAAKSTRDRDSVSLWFRRG